MLPVSGGRAVIGAVLVVVMVHPATAARAPRDKDPDAVAQEAKDAYRACKVKGAVDSLAWSPDSVKLAIQTKPVPVKGAGGRYETASNASSKIELWNVNEGRLERVLYETKDPIFSIEFSPDGKNLACAEWPPFEERADHPHISEVRLWDVVRGELTRTLEIATKDELGSPMGFDLLKIAFSPDSKKIAGCGKLVSWGDVIGQHLGGEVCLWDLESGKLKWRQRTLHTDIVYDVAFSPDGRLLASGGIDKLIRLLDPETGDLKQTLVGADWDGVEAISWSHDSALLASTGLGRGEAGNSRLWEVSSGRLSKTLWGRNEGTVGRTVFSPVDDALFGVVFAKEGEAPGWQVRRWNHRGEHVDNVTSKHVGGARLLRVSPDGKKIAVSTFSTWDQQVVMIFGVSPRVAPDR